MSPEELLPNRYDLAKIVIFTVVLAIVFYLGMTINGECCEKYKSNLVMLNELLEQKELPDLCSNLTIQRTVS